MTLIRSHAKMTAVKKWNEKSMRNENKKKYEKSCTLQTAQTHTNTQDDFFLVRDVSFCVELHLCVGNERKGTILHLPGP